MKAKQQKKPTAVRGDEDSQGNFLLDNKRLRLLTGNGRNLGGLQYNVC